MSFSIIASALVFSPGLVLGKWWWLAHTCNHGTGEAEARRWRVLGQPIAAPVSKTTASMFVCLFVLMGME